MGSCFRIILSRESLGFLMNWAKFLHWEHSQLLLDTAINSRHLFGF